MTLEDGAIKSEEDKKFLEEDKRKLKDNNRRLSNELEEYITRKNVKYLAWVAYEWAYKESRINDREDIFNEIFLLRENTVYERMHIKLQKMNIETNPSNMLVAEMDVNNLLKQIHKKGDAQ